MYCSLSCLRSPSNLAMVFSIWPISFLIARSSLLVVGFDEELFAFPLNLGPLVLSDDFEEVVFDGPAFPCF